MKKYIYFLVSILLLLCPLKASALVNPTEKFYVNDYANILSSETENYIFEHSKNLNDKTKAQIVVVTIPSLDGDSLEEYATDCFVQKQRIFNGGCLFRF